MRAHVQRGDRAGHGAQGGAADIVGVDLRRAREDHGDAERPGEDDRPQFIALRFGQRLRIVEPFRQIVRIEDDGGNANRPGERSGPTAAASR